MAALPDRSWPSVEAVHLRDRHDISSDYFYPPASTVAHVARLRPRMQELLCDSLDACELAAALEGLAAVAGTLEVLDLDLYPMTDDYTDDAENLINSTMPRAVEALTRLSSLRRLSVYWEHDALRLLAPALPALASLTSLVFVGGEQWERAQPQQQQLDLQPGSLRELTLTCQETLHGLRAMPRLDGVTKLSVAR